MGGLNPQRQVRSRWRRKRESQLPGAVVATSNNPVQERQKLKATNDADDSTMAGFLSKKDEIDFDLAASAFPDISLDGSGEIPTPTFRSAPVVSHQTSTSSFADFDDFVTPPPHNDVKVTGEDEFEQFESQFPDIDVPVERKFPQPLVLVLIIPLSLRHL